MRPDETFKIGVIGPMTGDHAQYGTSVYNATKIALTDEINENGGFNGYKVEILDAGDQGDRKAVNAYNDLIDKGMQMLCGTVTSGSCIAVEAERLRIHSSSHHPQQHLTVSGREQTSSVCAFRTSTGTKSAQYISEHKLYSLKVAVLYDSSADYNSGVHDAFVAAVLMTDLK